jgi:hypothetical protein
MDAEWVAARRAYGYLLAGDADNQAPVVGHVGWSEITVARKLIDEVPLQSTSCSLRH